MTKRSGISHQYRRDAGEARVVYIASYWAMQVWTAPFRVRRGAAAAADPLGLRNDSPPEFRERLQPTLDRHRQREHVKSRCRIVPPLRICVAVRSAGPEMALQTFVSHRRSGDFGKAAFSPKRSRLR